MVAPGVVLNKDGSFTCGLRFRGPDLESASDLELMSVRARLNNALKRLGSGWCLHVEARRRPAQPYPTSEFEIAAAWLVDAERRSLFETSEPAYETDYRAALTWLPPADQTRRVERVLFDGADPASRDWRTALDAFARETAQIVDLLADALPEVAMLDDVEILTWLHDCVSPRSVRLALPATPTGRGDRRVVAIRRRGRVRGATIGTRPFLGRRALGRRTAAITGPWTRIGARRAHARSGALHRRRRADLGRCGGPEFSHPGAVGGAAPSAGFVRAASGPGRAPG